MPHVAVFDTAFHTTLPAAARTYAIDRGLAARHGIRRYGFHGTSRATSSRRAAELLGRPLAELNLIVLHLGNGASATAVRGGRSVDTSMGLTPLEGLVMGTRSGDIDPAVAVTSPRGRARPADVERAAQRHGGLVGLCGDNDMRAVLSRAAGDAPARAGARRVLPPHPQVRRRLLRRAGPPRRHRLHRRRRRARPLVRAAALDGLSAVGIRSTRTATPPVRGAGDLARGSRVTVCVVPTDEELAIADRSAP